MSRRRLAVFLCFLIFNFVALCTLSIGTWIVLVPLKDTGEKDEHVRVVCMSLFTSLSPQIIATMGEIRC